ncbi:HPF/RaiA family ribosome-associated protein [Maribacter sp. ACAM166]|uniref:HPF/RaiA family ribosome-associated protein n=1 Tax=Maribacter sp. ACAM166 TaxID=2508996 RepID=UPI0010FF1163|nr:HPF/RaiA family ribosome-associated protein [Maribacter sp. ACAM166]TLP81721.1 HPF/RaiA family ribosome-associated protein [Maribacter sp. ACAM166]
MKVNIQFVQTAQRKWAEELVDQKLDDLGQKYDWIIGADVFFKEEKDTDGKGKICDIRLSLPGPRIFASSDEESFEASVAETIRDLEVQLKKRKAQMSTH